MRFQYVAVYSGALAVQCQLSPRTLEKTVRLPGVFAAVVVGPFSDILSVKSIKFMELLVTIGLSAIAWLYAWCVKCSVSSNMDATRSLVSHKLNSKKFQIVEIDRYPYRWFLGRKNPKRRVLIGYIFCENLYPLSVNPGKKSLTRDYHRACFVEKNPERSIESICLCFCG